MQQRKVMHVGGLQGRNVLVTQPTSAGKTAPAEILMLRSTCLNRKKALFIVPYVALVTEKVAGLRRFGERIELQVEGYFQNNGVIPPPQGPMICVSTVHKAHVLINKMIESDRIHELGCVVVDELRSSYPRYSFRPSPSFLAPTSTGN
jgi:POLQ-like helicase